MDNTFEGQSPMIAAAVKTMMQPVKMMVEGSCDFVIDTVDNMINPKPSSKKVTGSSSKFSLSPWLLLQLVPTIVMKYL